jgi:hypothetical protein
MSDLCVEHVECCEAAKSLYNGTDLRHFEHESSIEILTHACAKVLRKSGCQMADQFGAYQHHKSLESTDGEF